jgi:crotonobetainyl-CoA:carnitine CoA-transferase CaiB-like acyl-CoA transferase
MSSSRPLRGFTIIEIGHTVAAPYAGMVLAELGADVIKVETPDSGDYTRGMPPFESGRSAVYQALNRGKRGITVDLRDKAQSARLRKLIIKKADVLVHNLKFGAMANLGFGSAELLKEKPSLVYCNVGAFGYTGPLKAHPGYDPLMQAYAGLMSIMGEDGRAPVRVGVSITDMAAGLWAVVGIQAALLERSRTGIGGVVDTSLFETALGSLTVQFASFIASGLVPKREGSGLAQMVPYQAFVTSDSYVMLAAGNDNLFRKLCAALNRPDLATDPRFGTNKDRVANRAEIVGILAGIFAENSTAEWLQRLEAEQVPCSPINTIDMVVNNPQAEALGIFQTSVDGTEKVLGLPLSFDEVRPPFLRSAPKLGEHNREILSDDR